MTSMSSRLCFILLGAVTLITIVKASGNGCFENRDVFEEYTQYIQPLSLENRIYYSPATYEANKMTTTTEPNLPKYVKKTFTCLEEYSGNRMLVEVHVEGNTKVHYQCLEFKSLTKYVIRQAKTKLRGSKKKVDCEKDKYVTDEALLVALDVIKPEPCPLNGGYQMLLHEGEIIAGHCMDSTLTYNPNIRFQCDGVNVIADFGQDCEPPMLRKFQKMRRRHVAHLSCIGSWSEKGGIKSMLLRMRDMPYDLWCFHYKRMNETYDLLSVFMTIDGRCVEDAFHDESFPKKTSMFGHLARYVPSNDLSCSDSEYLDQCKENEAKCFESDGCPANCQRCNAKASISPCSFMEDTRGSWKTTTNSRHNLTVDIGKMSFKVSKYGEFSCRDNADRNLPGKVYPVVQADDTTSCMPYYACASVVSPIPGVLNFKLLPAWRDQDSGRPFTCKETDDEVGYVIPATDEQTITMIHLEKLVKSSCGFAMAHPFPTMIDVCQLVVEECGDGCNELYIQYDNNTCGDQHQGFELETNHTCYGKFDFTDGIRGLLTYSDFSEQYRCWIYNHERLFITDPDNCNSERVNAIFADREAHITYDPASALQKPMFGSSKDPNKKPGNGKQMLQNNWLVMVSMFLMTFLIHISSM